MLTIKILAFLSGCILALLKAVRSPLKKILAVNMRSLLLGMWLQGTWPKEMASLQHSGHLIRKVYLLCQHNSWCSAAPIIPKHNLPRPRHETTLKCVMLFLVSASKLCPQSPGILAHLLILKLEAFCLPCSSLSQKPLCFQFPWLCSLSGYNVYWIASQTNYWC